MEEAETAERESDWNGGKTRVNRRAFTEWRETVFCQSPLPH